VRQQDDRAQATTVTSQPKSTFDDNNAGVKSNVPIVLGGPTSS
jgi:hypothetical protein